MGFEMQMTNPSEMQNNENVALRFGVYGLMFGLLFPILATLGDILAQDMPLTLGSVIDTQKSTPLYWIIDAVPLFLALFAALVGRERERLTHIAELGDRLAVERDDALDRLRAAEPALEARVDSRERGYDKRADYLRAASEVGSAAASILDVNQLTRDVVELIRQRFDLYYVGLFQVDDKREWAVLHAGTGEAGKALLARGHRIKLGQGMIGWSVANAQARIASRAEMDTVRLETPELPLTRSEGALPLKSRGRVLGALSVQSAHPDAFDEEILTTLQLMADQVAVALDNARLFAQSQAAIEAQRRAYHETSRKGWSVFLQAQPKLGYRRNLYGISPIGDSDQRAETQAGGRKDGSAAGAVHQTNDSLTLVRPIQVHGQVIGEINARKPPDSGSWTSDEKEALEALCKQLGLALEDARLYQEIQRRARREQLVTEITSKIRAAPDLDSILQTAVQEMRRALGVSHGFIRLGTEDHLHPSHASENGETDAVGRSTTTERDNHDERST